MTNQPQCDTAVNAGTCKAAADTKYTEGIRLVGPLASTDTSKTFTVTLTWTAVAASSDQSKPAPSPS
jgi:hypothetical protein